MHTTRIIKKSTSKKVDFWQCTSGGGFDPYFFCQNYFPVPENGLEQFRIYHEDRPNILLLMCIPCQMRCGLM